MMRTRYRFSHRGSDGRYYWYTGRRHHESRVGLVFCSVDWFWNRKAQP